MVSMPKIPFDWGDVLDDGQIIANPADSAPAIDPGFDVPGSQWDGDPGFEVPGAAWDGDPGFSIPPAGLLGGFAKPPDSSGLELLMSPQEIAGIDGLGNGNGTGHMAQDSRPMPQQTGDNSPQTRATGVDWSGGDNFATTPHVTSSQGGDADAVTREINSLDPRLSPLLGPLQWVAVPNSIDQDSVAHIDPNEIPRGYPTTGDDSQLTLGDLDGLYEPNVKHVITATDGGNAGDGSYNTVFHETGHGADDVNEGLAKSADGSDASSGTAFMKAYQGDVPLMTPGEDDYYLQPRNGPSESYAESFARYFGGDPTLQRDWPNMYDFWTQRYPDVQPGQKWKWSEQ